jgi:hypothetical protein
MITNQRLLLSHFVQIPEEKTSIEAIPNIIMNNQKAKVLAFYL